MRLLFYGFLFVNILFLSKVKFLLLVEFLVDYFSYPAVPSLALFLCKLAAFSFVINHFVSVLT